MLLKKPGFLKRSNKGPWIEDLTGKRYGRWTVKMLDESVLGHVYWLCECDCGNSKSVIGVELTRGASTSCGCYAVERRIEGGFFNASTKHGMRKTPEYKVWCGMKTRCYNKNNEFYKYYGGKGITLSDEWVHSFEQFYSDMGERPDEGFSIERKDGNGPYAAWNCEWATRSTQANNVSDNKILTFDGVSLTMSEWANALGLNYNTLRSRKRIGWSDEKALFTPMRKPRAK